MKKWKDGTPRSTGNAFDWKGKSSIFADKTDRILSEKQIKTNALRVNREASLCVFVPPEHAQKIRMARI